MIHPPDWTNLDYGRLVNPDAPLNRDRRHWWMRLPQLTVPGAVKLYDIVGGRDAAGSVGFNNAGNFQTDGQTCTLTNGATYSFATHRGGYGSVDLDGTNDLVELPIFTIPTTLTFACWFYSDRAFTGTNYIYLFRATKYTGGTKLFDVLARYSDGSAYLGWYNLGTDGRIAVASTTLGFTSGVWQRFMMTSIPAGAHVFYLNGVQMYSTTTANNGSWDTNTAETIRIGSTRDADVATEKPFDGQMNDVSLWARVLTPDEALEDYKSSIRGYPRELTRVRTWSLFAPLVSAPVGRASQLTLLGVS